MKLPYAFYREFDLGAVSFPAGGYSRLFGKSPELVWISVRRVPALPEGGTRNREVVCAILDEDPRHEIVMVLAASATLLPVRHRVGLDGQPMPLSRRRVGPESPAEWIEAAQDLARVLKGPVRTTAC